MAGFEEKKKKRILKIESHFLKGKMHEISNAVLGPAARDHGIRSLSLPIRGNSRYETFILGSPIDQIYEASVWVAYNHI